MGLRQNTEVRNHGRNDRTMKRRNKEENREGIDKRRWGGRVGLAERVRWRGWRQRPPCLEANAKSTAHCCRVGGARCVF